MALGCSGCRFGPNYAAVIPLHRKQFPNSKADLAEALNASLSEYVHKAEPMVAVYARVFPYLDEIAINFDGAQIEPRLPVFPKPVGETRSAVEAAVVTLSGRHIRLQSAPINLHLEARDVVFHQGRDENGDAILLVHEVRRGHLTVSTAHADLETAIRTIAEQEAKKRGIEIEQTRVSLRARGARSLALEVRLQARKFMFRAKIEISGQIDIDEHFNAKISNLKCRGEGTIGSVACGAIDPVLKQVDGKSFSLLSLPLGEIKLRDIRITVADTIEVTADFGSAA